MTTQFLLCEIDISLLSWLGLYKCTLHPLPTGTCVYICMFVYFLFVWVHGFLLSSAFLLSRLAGVLYTCDFMYIWWLCFRINLSSPVYLQLNASVYSASSVHVVTMYP